MGGMHAWHGGVHAWHWGCVARDVWQGACVVGETATAADGTPQQTVRILLECILVGTDFTCLYL